MQVTPYIFFLGDSAQSQTMLDEHFLKFVPFEFPAHLKYGLLLLPASIVPV